MSRLGKQPIEVPKDVTVTQDGTTITVKGPKGELTRTFRNEVTIEITDEGIVVTPVSEDSRFAKALWGTYASHLRNMIAGVAQGFGKVLEVEGVGYRWTVSGDKLEMTLGYSHPVIMTIPEGLTVEAEKSKLTITGIDKELVGMFAADVRSKRKPEPYKGKGIRYQGEYIRRKQGKKTA